MNGIAFFYTKMAFWQDSNNRVEQNITSFFCQFKPFGPNDQEFPSSYFLKSQYGHILYQRCMIISASKIYIVFLFIIRLGVPSIRIGGLDHN